MALSDASSNRLARDVLENLLEGCQVVSFDYRYVYLNDAVVEHSRQPREALLGKTMMECFPGIEHTAMFAAVRACMTDRVHRSLENEFSYPDGSKGWFWLRFVPIPEGVCILSIDVSDRKRSEAELTRTEAQLRHAQKMEAVGRLAGGVAHDFNNLLSVILSYTTLILGDLRPEDPLRSDLEEVRAAGERAADLTRQLLAFSRQQVIQARVLDLNQVVAGMEKMLPRLLGADVELTFLRSTGAARITADPGMIEQVIMNLVVNARDAMPRGGKLTIEVKKVELDEGYARAHVGVEPGRYVMLAVSDNGEGMDKETQARAFEPFFTTKDKEKGTGLGLATVYGIVKQNNGHIWLYSEPGVGTTFRLYFPHSDDAVVTVSSQPPLPDSSDGHETILLVEDDDQLRQVARSILRRSGYIVLEASNAGEALLVCEQHPAPIHLLVTDVVLPKMSGPQLAERLAGLRPAMRVLFMSGYTDEAIMQHGLLDSGLAYLQKPLTPESLSRKVREVLGPRTLVAD